MDEPKTSSVIAALEHIEWTFESSPKTKEMFEKVFLALIKRYYPHFLEKEKT